MPKCSRNSIAPFIIALPCQDKVVERAEMLEKSNVISPDITFFAKSHLVKKAFSQCKNQDFMSTYSELSLIKQNGQFVMGKST